MVSFSVVFCQVVGAGVHGKYPPEVGFNLHCPKGLIFRFACLSCAVAICFPSAVEKFWLVTLRVLGIVPWLQDNWAVSVIFVAFLD